MLFVTCWLFEFEQIGMCNFNRSLADVVLGTHKLHNNNVCKSKNTHCIKNNFKDIQYFFYK